MDAPELFQYCTSQIEACARENVLYSIKIAKSYRLVVIYSLISFGILAIVIGVEPYDLGQLLEEVVFGAIYFIFQIRS